MEADFEWTVTAIRDRVLGWYTDMMLAKLDSSFRVWYTEYSVRAEKALITEITFAAEEFVEDEL